MTITLAVFMLGNDKYVKIITDRMQSVHSFPGK